MKKIYNFDGQINDTELTSAEMVTIAINNCMRDYAHNPQVRKLLTEASKNKKDIARAISQSQSHKMGVEQGFAEVHCIVLVDGEAVLLKSLSIGSLTDGNNNDRIMFVYGKRYNRYNYMDFNTDFYENGGLDSVWCDFNYNVN